MLPGLEASSAPECCDLPPRVEVAARLAAAAAARAATTRDGPPEAGSSSVAVLGPKPVRRRDAVGRSHGFFAGSAAPTSLAAAAAASPLVAAPVRCDAGTLLLTFSAAASACGSTFGAASALGPSREGTGLSSPDLSASPRATARATGSAVAASAMLLQSRSTDRRLGRAPASRLGSTELLLAAAASGLRLKLTV